MKKLFKIFSLLFLFPLSISYGNDKKSSEFFLEKCPDKPNCVISLEEVKETPQYIEPIHFQEKNIEKTKEKLMNSIKELGGSVVETTPFYIKSEFFSKFFKFKDVSEFVILPEKNLILIRSGAVTGYSDFGVNRKRIEKIRETMK